MRSLTGQAVVAWGVEPDLESAFENVVDNAVRYSRPGGGVRVSMTVSEGRARIAVADDGIGVPEELQDDVFLEFVRGPEARRLAPSGTGLGLAIVKAATEMHGGTVELTSRPGRGTVVTISSPVRHAPAPRARQARASVA